MDEEEDWRRPAVWREGREAAARRMEGFRATANGRFWRESLGREMAGYRRRPERFAERILGSRWWEKQQEVARSVAGSRRVAVKSANGVGKTYLAADLALWFLYTHQPSIVLTTAPSWQQVRSVLWEEIRRKFNGARITLPGKLLQARLSPAGGWFMLGLSPSDGVRFQGFHAEHLLILFDEASGIPPAIWEAAEGVAVGKDNRILAIGNPLQASGRFYEIFRDGKGWRTHTISALDHPNVTGRGHALGGGVTPESIDQKVAEWCEETEGIVNREKGGGSADDPTPYSLLTTPELFEWRGRRYRASGMFRARVLGEFPDSDDEALIPLRWIEAAMERKLPAEGYTRAAADIARFGGDATVIGLRIGPVVTRLETVRGCDTMEVSGRICRLAYEEHPQSIALDSIGIGAGVVDRLVELRIEGLDPVNVALPAYDTERFANRRAELYWGLRERFRTGEIALPRHEQLARELAGIRYKLNSRGQIQIESKEDMKKRGERSPDHADMLALLFDGAGESLLRAANPGSTVVAMPSPAAQMRAEMARW